MSWVITYLAVDQMLIYYLYGTASKNWAYHRYGYGPCCACVVLSKAVALNGSCVF